MLGQSIAWTRRAGALGPLVASGLLMLAVAPTRAQSPPAPPVLYACYIKSSGTVYRIKVPNTPENCTSAQHVEFSWTDGDAASQHGALSGLTSDDHPQYLLADGVRNTTNGFAVTGTAGAGSIPASGHGVRLMWYPKKAAFRAGQASFSDWDDAQIGGASTATGNGTKASGAGSIAMGLGTTASGSGSTAMGLVTTASGSGSVAIGFSTRASGLASTAMGDTTIASGDYSTALGRYASTNNQIGSFVYGDASTTLQQFVTSTVPNQFVVRAAGGTMFYSASDLSAGVSLASGGGSWASVSDVRRKDHFRDLDADTVLAKVARMPVREWNYKSQDPTVRHVGPTAQDFYAAFKLAASDTTITTTDMDGIALLAIQALERRTAQVSTLEARVAELERRLTQLIEAASLRSPRPR